MRPTEETEKILTKKFLNDVDVLVITNAEHFLSAKAEKTREYLIDQFKGSVIFVLDEEPKSSLPQLEHLVQKLALNAMDVPQVDKKSALKILDSAISMYNKEIIFKLICQMNLRNY